jgi:hypothetical protein
MVPGIGNRFPRPTVIDDAARKELCDIIDKLKPKVGAIAVASTNRAG